MATERAVAVLRQVISETRESRDQALLLRELISTVIGTAVLIGVIGLVLFLRRALSRRLGRLAERAAAVTSVGGTQVVTTDRLLPFANRALTVVASTVIVISLYRWVSYVLSQFPYTRPWGESLRGVLVNHCRGPRRGRRGRPSRAGGRALHPADGEGGDRDGVAVLRPRGTRRFGPPLAGPRYRAANQAAVRTRRLAVRAGDGLSLPARVAEPGASRASRCCSA